MATKKLTSLDGDNSIDVQEISHVEAMEKYNEQITIVTLKNTHQLETDTSLADVVAAINRDRKPPLVELDDTTHVAVEEVLYAKGKERNATNVLMRNGKLLNVTAPQAAVKNTIDTALDKQAYSARQTG